jgi:hypothetical protein
MMLVKPAPGVLVRDPVSLLPLPPEGKEVPETTYWTRRLAEGSITVIQTDQISDSAAPKKGKV